MDDLNFKHGGNIYEIKRRYGKGVIDFSANVSPLGLATGIKETLYKDLNRISCYPDPEAKDIREKIAKFWGIRKDNLLLGNGSVELIYLLTSLYRPKTASIPIPTFSEYEYSIRNLNCKIQFLKLKEKKSFKLDLSKVIRSDIFFLCHPNNPTGNFILDDLRVVERLADKLIIVDEAFMDFLVDQEKYTLIWKAIDSKKIAVLRTFTKFFGLAGLRIGYLITHKKIIDRLRQCQPPWMINSLAQLAVQLILDDKEYISKTYRLIEKERRYLFEQLSKIKGLEPFPSVANFLLIKIERDNLTSDILVKRLIEKGILVRDCSNFRNLNNNRYIRIAVRTHKDNLVLLGVLNSTINTL